MMWFARRAARTDATRGALVLWGGWLLVTAVVLSFMKGIMHPYYTVTLAPSVAAVIGISVRAAPMGAGRDGIRGRSL